MSNTRCFWITFSLDMTVMVMSKQSSLSTFTVYGSLPSRNIPNGLRPIMGTCDTMCCTQRCSNKLQAHFRDMAGAMEEIGNNPEVLLPLPTPLDVHLARAFRPEVTKSFTFSFSFGFDFRLPTLLFNTWLLAKLRDIFTRQDHLCCSSREFSYIFMLTESDVRQDLATPQRRQRPETNSAARSGAKELLSKASPKEPSTAAGCRFDQLHRY